MYVGKAPLLGDFVPPRPKTILSEIPDGPAGTAATLRIMRDFVKGSTRDPDQLIRSKARELLSHVPPRQWFAEIRALHGYVRDQIRYLRDPVDVELVQTPEKTIEFAQGDCDDKSTLLGALLHSVGHPVRFAALGFEGRPFSHVLVETRVNHTGVDKRDWLPLETIVPKEPGWFPDGVTSVYRVNV